MTRRKSRTINKIPLALPKPEPSRLVRFTDLDPTTVCLFDQQKNILRIDQALYDRLSPQNQTRVFRARESITITPQGNTSRQRAAE